MIYALNLKTKSKSLVRFDDLNHIEMNFKAIKTEIFAKGFMSASFLVINRQEGGNKKNPRRGNNKKRGNKKS